MHAGKNKQKYDFSFSVAVLLLLFTHREGCAEKKKIVFFFLFDTGTQSIAVSVTRYVLLLFLTAPGSCCRPPCRPAFMCVSCYRLLQGHPAWSNGAMEHLDPQNAGCYADLSFQKNLSCTGCTYVVLALTTESCMDV